VKVLFFCRGHFDSGLELFYHLQKKIDATLVIQIEGDRVLESVLDVDVSEISLGLHTGDIDKYKLIKEITKIFDIPLGKIVIVKYNSLSIRDLKNLKISKAFSSWVKKNKFSIIHYYGISMVWLQHIIFLSKIKKYYSVHDIVTHSGKDENIPFQIVKDEETGNINLKPKKGSFSFLRRGYQSSIFLFVIKLSKKSKFILLSQVMKESLLKKENLSVEKCTSIKFGVLNCYRKYMKSNIKSAPNVVLFFGRISQYKGIDFFIKSCLEVVREKKDTKIIIAGTGLYKYDKSDIINNPNFQIIDKFLTNEFMVELLQKCTFVVCPYLEATQSGVVMTSFAMGKPVIVTDVGAFKEYVEDYKTGIIVPPKDITRLKEAILKLLNDDKLLNNLNQNISKMIESNDIWENSVNSLLEYYSLN
jgi:glycosyltransferase involved in cell wall biosynthesis